MLGYHLHPHGEGVLLPRRHYGLGEQKGVVLAAIEHVGYLILHGGPGRGDCALWNTADIQYRPGEPVYLWRFTDILKKHDIKISMDGQGRWMDNVFIESLWKSVKYEDVYLKAYNSIAEVRKELTKWFDRYNSAAAPPGA